MCVFFFFSGTLLLSQWSNGCLQFDLWLLCFFKSSLNIWKFKVHVLLKTGLENFEHYFPSMWEECNCVVAWKCQFSFQFERRAILKECSNHHTIEFISHASKVILQILQVGFSSRWTENFQVYQLGFEEAEEPKINLPTFTGSWRKQDSSRKTSTSALLTPLKPLTVWITPNLENS